MPDSRTVQGILDRRQGLNCNLLYADEGGKTQTYSCRVDYYTYDFNLIASESQAKTRHAFYPHRVTPTQFAIQVLLRGGYEYRHFMDWIATYSWAALSTNDNAGGTRVMVVALAGRNFVRIGVPTTGFAWGDQVGKAVWKVQLVFEAANDALTTSDQVLAVASTFKDAPDAVKNQDLQYFYPLSAYANGTSDSVFYDYPNTTYVAAAQNNAAVAEGRYLNAQRNYLYSGDTPVPPTVRRDALSSQSTAVVSSYSSWSN